MQKLKYLKVFWIILSFLFAWGFNNLTRELSSLDNGVIILMTFSSLSFILGALLYHPNSGKINNENLIHRFILAGMLIIFA